jgi:rhodanese-related sulfurtransferase
MTQRDYKQVPAAQVPEILQRGAAIVDVRRPEEWQLTGTVADSILLTFFDADGNSDPEEWLEKLNQQVSADVPLLLI